MVNIHLRRMGKKKEPYYRIIVADSRAPRDGRFIDNIGSYDPRGKKETKIDVQKFEAWVKKGARPTRRVKQIIDYYTKGTLEGKIVTDEGETIIREPKEIKKPKKTAPKEEAPKEEMKEEPKAEAPDEAPKEKTEEAPAQEAKEEVKETPEEVKEEAPAQEVKEEATEKEPAEKAEEETPSEDTDKNEETA